jgi:hypothetical protein
MDGRVELLPLSEEQPVRMTAIKSARHDNFDVMLPPAVSVDAALA